MPRGNTVELVCEKTSHPIAQPAANIAGGFDEMRRVIQEFDLGLREEIRVLRKEV